MHTNSKDPLKGHISALKVFPCRYTHASGNRDTLTLRLCLNTVLLQINLVFLFHNFSNAKAFYSFIFDDSNVILYVWQHTARAPNLSEHAC